MPRGPKHPVVDGMKCCTACEQTLPVADFLPDNRSGGYQARCRACTAKRDHGYYEKSRNRYLASARKQWNSMDEQQRETDRERQRQRRVTDPERIRRYDRQKQLKKYGITLGDFERLLAAQGGTCALCGGPPLGRFGMNYHVDHDHMTGVVRGLLCSRCNGGLGALGDTVESLQRAISYLQSPPASRLEPE